MIKSLDIIVPREIFSRAGLDQKKREDFERVTGIEKTRHWLMDTEVAFEKAAKLARVEDANRIDAVFLVTQTPWRSSPCHAVELARIWGLRSDVACFDVNQSCDGFVYGLWLADTMCFDRVLFVCWDQLFYDQGSEEERFIFSDAMTVCDFQFEDNDSDISDARFLTIPSGASRLNADIGGRMVMDGGYVFDTVTKEIPPLLKPNCQNYDFLCQHQSNRSMMRLVDARSGFSGRSLYSIQEYGNQSMNSIPTALVYNESKILGKRVLLAGYGAGFCAAVMGLTWPSKPVGRIVEIG